MRRGAILLSAALLAMSVATMPAGADAQENPNADKNGKVRQDPEGTKGVAPYEKLLGEGKSAITKGELDIALGTFKKATLAKPERMYAYVLLAQTYMRKGDNKSALGVINTARTKQGDAATKSKMYFTRAELLERAANAAKPETGKSLAEALASVWDKAKEGWSTFKVFLESNTKLPDYKGTADKRKDEVAKRVQREKDYGIIRARIDKNAAARSKKARK